MKVLFLGDVVGSIGCKYLLNILDKYKMKNNIDVVIANGENSADGNGISQKSAKLLFDCGVDVITTGNHIFKQHDYKQLLENETNVLRPANIHNEVPGLGYYIFNYKDIKVGVINLLGSVYMPSNYENPFKCMDNLLEKIKANVIFVDFHAEATAEKLCMAHYLGSKITALVGTHTHIQTADEQILPYGTAYITDLGMVGPINSVLGVETELAVAKISKGLPVKFKNAVGPCQMCGVMISIDDKTFKVNDIERICVKEISY